MRLVLPTWKTVLKWIIGVVGAILIGAIGSGVWQNLLGPGRHTGSRWLLDLASLGLLSYKNSVYQQVAADNQFLFAYEAFPMVLWMSTTILWIFLGYVSFELNQLQRFWTEHSDAAANRKPDSTEVDGARQLKAVKKLRLFLYAFTLATIFLFGEICVSSAKRQYINSADAHYQQVLRVALPYLDTAERARLNRSFRR